MDIKEFVKRYKDAVGETVPLPIAFGYSNQPVSGIKKVPKCMIGAISKVRNGESLTLCSENVLCGGGGLYTAFREMPERVPMFVSEIEHYKKTKEMVIDYVKAMDIRLSEKPYLNFVRVDQLESWDGVEALLFFATPDVLSGLCMWAFYDNNALDAVCTPFASGCSGIITFPVNENRKNGRRCFIGMLDTSARPLIPEHELTFTIPMSRFKEMMETMNDSSLYQKAFSVLRKRIDKNV